MDWDAPQHGDEASVWVACARSAPSVTFCLQLNVNNTGVPRAVRSSKQLQMQFLITVHLNSCKSYSYFCRQMMLCRQSQNNHYIASGNLAQICMQVKGNNTQMFYKQWAAYTTQLQPFIFAPSSSLRVS